MDNRLDEKGFVQMLRTGLARVAGAVSKAANASYEKGRAKRAKVPPKQQKADAVKKDGSPWHDFRDQGPV